MSVRLGLWSLIVLGGSLLSGGCATIASPDGGPRDLTPPELLRTVPANGARNVASRTIVLEFSEPVQVKDLSKNLIVAPLIPDENHYKITEKRNSVTLTYEQPFAPNTTYTFNFGDAVVDITESNKAKNVRLAFSTGAQLDSGIVRGTVQELLTAKPVDNASVMLYPVTDTAGVRRGRPYYLARTDKRGAFSLENLKNGAYYLYALVDKNQSNRYEEGEKIAYLPQPVQVGTTPDSVRLLLVRPDSRRPLITTQQPAAQYYRVAYNEGLRRARLTALAGRPDTAALRLATLVAEKGRAVVLFNTPALTEGRYLLTAVDSAGNAGRDTVDVRFSAPAKAPTVRAPLYSYVGNPRDVYRQGQVQVQFAVPVVVAATQPFATLREDSAATRRPLRLPQDGRLNDDHTQLTINLNTKATSTVTLLLDSTAIQTVTGQPLGFRPLRLRVTEEAPTGTLSGTIQTAYQHFQLQVINQDFQPVAVLTNPGKTFRFDKLPPGTYRLRVLIDADNSGTWRAGDPALQLPPEPVYLYPQPLPPVRANWEQENIILTF